MIIAVFIVVFIYGYIFKNNGHLAIINPLGNSIIYSGVLRGIAGISLGGICYKLCKLLKTSNLSKNGRILISMLEVVGYIGSIVLMGINYKVRLDFLILILITISIIITFSKKSYTVKFEGYVPNAVGKLSMAIFLSDAVARKVIILLMPHSTRNDKIIPSFIALFTISIIILFSEKYIKMLVFKIKHKLFYM